MCFTTSIQYNTIIVMFLQTQSKMGEVLIDIYLLATTTLMVSHARLENTNIYMI